MYEDASGNAELNKVVSEVREGKLERLMCLEELGASQDEVARLLLEVLEPDNYQRLIKSYGGSHRSSPLPKICQLCVSGSLAAHRRELTWALVYLLRVIDKRGYWDRDALIKAIGQIGEEEILGDLIYELDLEKGIIEENFGLSGTLKRAGEKRWDELKREALHRFDPALIAAVRTLIDLMDHLSPNKGWGRGGPLAERKRFLQRRDVATWLKPRQELLLHCLRFLLTRYAEVEDDVAAILGASLTRKSLKKLKELASEDADYDVRMRARIILANRDGTFAKELVPHGRFENISHTMAYYNGVMASRGRAYAGHTWIKDETVERILHDAFKKTDDRFSAFFSEQIGKHEPELTERLVATMEDEFEPVKGVIEAWGKALVSGSVKVDFSHRDAQPQEDEWHADIAFLLDCSLEAEFAKKHAILVQSKKMNHSAETGRFSQSWTIDIAQCRELVEKSAFSYYFLYGPHEYPSVKTLVIPATTLLGIVDETATPGQGSKNIRYEDVRHSARSLADFMLYDFIGCWVGDSDDEVISLAEGGGGVRPVARHLVTVTIIKGRELQ